MNERRTPLIVGEDVFAPKHNYNEMCLKAQRYYVGISFFFFCLNEPYFCCPCYSVLDILLIEKYGIPTTPLYNYLKRERTAGSLNRFHTRVCPFNFTERGADRFRCGCSQRAWPLTAWSFPRRQAKKFNTILRLNTHHQVKVALYSFYLGDTRYNTQIQTILYGMWINSYSAT